MKTIFRKLNHKRHWDEEQWLSAGDVKSDATKCLQTVENTLSVFVLEKPEEQMDRVVAALALTRGNLGQVDVAIVPEEILEKCEIKRDRVQAETPDSEVNQWHIDLVELTVDKIAKFASAIKSEGQIKRYAHKAVKTAIQQSLTTNCIDVEQINEEFISTLIKRGINLPV